MAKRTPRQLAQMEACFRAMDDGRTWRVNDVARTANMSYATAYAALHRLVEDGRAEKCNAQDMTRLHRLCDGRVVALGPDSSMSIGFRQVAVSAAQLEELEYLYHSPAADRG